MFASAVGLLISSITLINILLMTYVSSFILIEMLVIANTLILGLVAGFALKLINDTEEQEEKTKEQIELLKELESNQRVEQNSL